MGSTRTMSQSVYRIPHIRFEVNTVVTNTTPMGAYRGAGRPEAAALVERILDMAADELGMDPVVLRRRNLLPNDEFPYTTVTGRHLRQRRLRRVARRWRSSSPATTTCSPSRRRAASVATPSCSASASSMYVEVTGGGRWRVLGDRGAPRRHRHAQGGHVRARAGPRDRVLADRRRPSSGIPLENIRFVQSDTALGAARLGHGRVALAADRRQLGARGVAPDARQGEGARGRAARGVTPTTS